MTRALFVVPPDVRDVMNAHASRERPLECCGLLVGRSRVITAAVPMYNVAESATRYRIDDRQHIDLRRALRQSDPPIEIVGVYHSHPAGAARPSGTDVIEAYYPDWLYVIVGWAGARVRIRGFVLENARMRPVRLAASIPIPSSDG